jgi:hypothetical protein
MLRSFWTGLVVVLGLSSLALPAEAGPRPRQQVVIQDRDAGTLIVKAPRPEVTYLLMRARLADQVARPDQKLAPRIEQAVTRSPF